MYMCLYIYTDSFITPYEWTILIINAKYRYHLRDCFVMNGSGNLEEGEVPCDGAQRCGDPTISLLREQDLVL